MEQEFVTIAEAVKLTGESDVTLMRVLKEALEASGISLESILRKEQREKGMMYLLNKDFLLKALEGEPIEKEEFEEAELRAEEAAPERSSASAPKTEDKLLEAKDEMIAVLQESLETKDTYIEDLSKKIDQLIERDRETNFLLKGLQDRIFLLERGASPSEGRPAKKENKSRQV